MLDQVQIPWELPDDWVHQLYFLGSWKYNIGYSSTDYIINTNNIIFSTQIGFEQFQRTICYSDVLIILVIHDNLSLWITKHISQ